MRLGISGSQVYIALYITNGLEDIYSYLGFKYTSRS